MLGYIAFLSCLEFAVLNSVYQNTILKPKQVICLENVMRTLKRTMLLFAKFKLRGDLLLHGDQEVFLQQ
jgi:hypothetical protein